MPCSCERRDVHCASASTRNFWISSVTVSHQGRLRHGYKVVCYEFKLRSGDAKLKLYNSYTLGPQGGKWLYSCPCLSTQGVGVSMGPITVICVTAKRLSILTDNQTPVRNTTSYFIIYFSQTHTTILRENNKLQQTHHM
jgi:hypothetical protein